MGFFLFLGNLLDNSCNISFLDYMRSKFVPTTTAMSKLLGVQKKISILFLQDGRFSITIVCTESYSGVTVPTIFLLKGQRYNGIFTDEFLRSNGYALGSTILMTEKELITNIP